jgi:hypothetical protein
MDESDLVSMAIGSTVLFGLSCLCFYKYKEIKTHTDKYRCEYKKMYRIIELASGLDSDPYNRKISPKVVKKFCKIAHEYSIDLDNITDGQFDFIYKTYSEYLIDKFEKKINK